MAAARKRGSLPTEDYPDKPRSNVYTGLLLLSLLAMISASVLVFLDYSQYPPNKPPQPPTAETPLGPPLPH